MVTGIRLEPGNKFRRYPERLVMAERTILPRESVSGRRPRGTGVAVAAMKAVARIPLIDRLHPWVKPEKSDIRWLPINEDIRMPENTPMPLALLDTLIGEASHRVIVDYCGCRRAFRCEDYPVEIGCLMMGDSALEITRLGPHREVSVEEAREHARRAADAGLVPVVGKARVDNFLFGVKDRSRLLTTCFCCECCCITRFTSAIPIKHLEPIFPRLESVTIAVTDECRGCGKCVEHCYVQAISVIEGRAHINDYCRACGRCAAVCPNKAVEVRITDPDFVEKTLERIRSYVKYD